MEYTINMALCHRTCSTKTCSYLSPAVERICSKLIIFMEPIAQGAATPMRVSNYEELGMHHAACTSLQQTRDFCATQAISGGM